MSTPDKADKDQQEQKGRTYEGPDRDRYNGHYDDEFEYNKRYNDDFNDTDFDRELDKDSDDGKGRESTGDRGK